VIGALAQFEGTLIFVSHDVYFIKSIATSVLHVRSGTLSFYPGDYDYYLAKTSAVSEQAGLVAGDSSPNEAAPARPVVRGKDQKRAEAEERQIRSRARKEWELKLHSVESRIVHLEHRQKELTHALEQPEVYEDSSRARETSAELSAISRELERLAPEWEKLGAKSLEFRV
jgi:ATP-binding cassette, subfamily F, member 3